MTNFARTSGDRFLPVFLTTLFATVSGIVAREREARRRALRIAV
jgi:hypothetical protein